jgi:hypothetical protein
MDWLYLWPEHPVLSLFVVYVATAIFLWAARAPMRTLVHTVAESMREGFMGAATWAESAAERVKRQARSALLAAGKLEAHGRLERELQYIDSTFGERIGQYQNLHRRLDESLHKLEADYQACSVNPPDVPGWTQAAEAISSIPNLGDANGKVLESIRQSSRDAERKALQAYREDTASRHKLLAGMAPCWKEVRTLMGRIRDSVQKALEVTRRIDTYYEDYQKLNQDDDGAARALTYSATKLFVVSCLVLGVALGGAFVNFQLIALPMSELVPAGARLGSIPVSAVSALVIVLMETALGIFIMDMLGITELLPKLQNIPSARRRLILGLSLAGLFFLAAVESSLAVLREQIAAADAALKLSLAGDSERVVAQVSHSMIPVVGQAVLGFILPWILAMAAIPLEMLIDSARHVSASLLGVLLQGIANLGRMAGYGAGALEQMLLSIYDVYISIPLRIEAMLRGDGGLAPAPAHEVARREAKR